MKHLALEKMMNRFRKSYRAILGYMVAPISSYNNYNTEKNRASQRSNLGRYFLLPATILGSTFTISTGLIAVMMTGLTSVLPLIGAWLKDKCSRPHRPMSSHKRSSNTRKSTVSKLTPLLKTCNDQSLTNEDENSKLKKILKGYVDNYKDDGANNDDSFCYNFHKYMQDPNYDITTLKYDEKDSKFLCNGILSEFDRYYDDQGNHIFGKKINKLIINNIWLCIYIQYNPYGSDIESGGGAYYIAELIKKNPKIESIDLSNTELNDKEAVALIDALNHNTRLLELNLAGNHISAEKLGIIKQKIDENKNNIPHVIKNTSQEESSLKHFAGSFFKDVKDIVKHAFCKSKEIEEVKPLNINDENVYQVKR